MSGATRVLAGRRSTATALPSRASGRLAEPEMAPRR
jgi:hypothetical protein